MSPLEEPPAPMADPGQQAERRGRQVSRLTDQRGPLTFPAGQSGPASGAQEGATPRSRLQAQPRTWGTVPEGLAPHRVPFSPWSPKAPSCNHSKPRRGMRKGANGVGGLSGGGGDAGMGGGIQVPPGPRVPPVPIRVKHYDFYLD